jgi:uncharacterized protein (DUF58 family)
MKKNGIREFLGKRAAAVQWLIAVSLIACGIAMVSVAAALVAAGVLLWLDFIYDKIRGKTQ